VSPISWGDSQPTPDKKAHFEHVRHADCPYCSYVATAQRRTKAHKLVNDHIRRKHPGQPPLRLTVHTEHADWIPAPLSPVGKAMDEDADSIRQKAEEEGKEYDCLICKVSGKPDVEPVRFAIASTIFPSGEQGIFTMAVCDDHRGGWVHEPKDGLVFTDGIYRVDKNMPEDEPFVEDDDWDTLSPEAREKVRRAVKGKEQE
jgi:hypothetical protein